VLEARGKAAARMFALGEIPEAEYAEAARVRKAELDKIAAELATPMAADPLAEFRDGANAGEVWRGLSLARKRGAPAPRPGANSAIGPRRAGQVPPGDRGGHRAGLGPVSWIMDEVA
jgi:hypothetical protein